ncbi:alpha/beta hydrolase [Laspinema sp. D1]|uniref:Alpha/beta hydrolase n=1 Tax=Laspinema palackyanum D2a TaxID=2953684 RepID=A0ABT2MSV2_9CYAN|nr:alpha/beta hydrolase [Laspinema sp. D2b]MCT7967829.1 alpha/beta hydrolase [Laspinema sp. D2a]
MLLTTSILARNNVNLLGQGRETMIFAHGFGTDQTAWDNQVKVFEPNYRIVLFDLVGCGNSDLSAYSPRRYSSLHSYAEDLLDLCHELKLENCIFVGHSVSAMVGILAALSEPKRFKQLILLNPSPRYLNDGGYVGGFEQSDLDGLYQAMSSNYHAWASGFAQLIMGNLDRPELGIGFAKTILAMRPDIALSIAKTIFQSDHRGDLSRLQVPTVILQSTHDPAVPAVVGEYLAEKIPNSTLIPIKSEGHLPHLSTPEAVSKAIASCLSN